MRRIAVIIFIILFINFINNDFIYSIKKPKIVSGINSSGYFNKLEENENICPSTLNDNLFFSIEEELSDFFKFRYRADFYNSHYNYYSENLENLKSYNLKNFLTLFFYIKKPNEIKLMTRPIVYYKYGELYLQLMNKLQYKLSLKKFSFGIFYSHLHIFKAHELFYHNAGIFLYWSLPKRDFIKFRTHGNVYFQHYIENDDEFINKEVSFLKSVRVGFEVAIDFNKIDFKEVFESKNDDEEFFDE